jgi:hypothetical protein
VPQIPDFWTWETTIPDSRPTLFSMHRLVLMAALILVPSVHAQWQLQTSNTTADLRGIHSIGNGIAWASGTNGTILRTEDGGYVWQSCSIPPGAEKLDFRGIQAFDANTAVVMSSGKGDLSRLYKTTDGCHTWKLLFSNPDPEGFWDAIQFPGPLNGFLAGDAVNGKLYVRLTRDGGLSWKRFEDDEALKAKDGTVGMFAASNSTLLALRNGSLIFAAANGGNSAGIYGAVLYKNCGNFMPPAPKWCPGYTWAGFEKIPLNGNSTTSGVFALAYKLEPDGAVNVIVAAGGDYRLPDSTESTCTFTTDSGETWHPAQTPPHGYRSSVTYDASTKTWITVGPNGTDISSDDGRNWRPLHPDPARHEAPDADRNWNALSLPFVVGPKGRIGKLNEATLKRKPSHCFRPTQDPTRIPR